MRPQVALVSSFIRTGTLMRCSLAAALFFYAACAPLQRTEPIPDAPGLAITSINGVDVVGGRVLPEQMVLIAGNRIQAVGSRAEVRIPAGA